MSKDLGKSTSYAYYVAEGGTKTPQEYGEMLVNIDTVATRAEDAADSAAESATGALNSKNAAQTAATTATNKASEATTAATTATTKAAEASTSASTATSAKDTAVSASQTATTKATEATTAAATATSAKTDAVAANTAAQSAKTAAQTAQTGAETAAASVQSSAAQIATNAEDISQLKSEITDKSDTADMLKAFPTDTASGSVASFADGANVPVKSLIVNIDPVQSGSGDPSHDNVRPISGWSEVNINACGVNVWDEEWIVASNNRINSKNPISVVSGESYYFKTPVAMYINAVDKNGAYVSYLGGVTNDTMVIPDGVKYIGFSILDSYGTTYNHDISINYPSTDHDYHPYSGQSINIALGQTVYGGTLDVLSGELVIDRAMVDLGTLNWSYVTISTNLFVFESRNLVSVIASRSIISDTYKNPYTDSTTASAINNAPDKSIGVNKGPNQTRSLSNGAVFVKDSAYTDATAFKTAMSGAMLCYPLVTPITVQLTPNEVTALLGSNNVWADSGDSTVEYRADPTLYIQRLTEPDADMVADANITSGQYFMVGNTLYKATANIASGATISPNVNCTRKSLSEALNELNA